MNTYSVYMHVFPNGKKYIGITCQKPVHKRWFSNGSGYRECPKMWKAINKYGWDNVEHIVLYEGLSKDEAERMEIKLIKELNTIKNGYNIENGGNVTGTHSEETKAKISAGNKGKKKPPLSEEARKKISLANSGQGNSFFGKHHTEEVKKNHSEFMKGNQYNKGHHHTAEFKRMKSEQMREKYANGGNPRCKEVYMIKPNGSMERFYSLRKAAEVANVQPSTMLKTIKEEKTLGGCKWRYANA